MNTKEDQQPLDRNELRELKKDLMERIRQLRIVEYLEDDEENC